MHAYIHIPTYADYWRMAISPKNRQSLKFIPCQCFMLYGTLFSTVHMHAHIPQDAKELKSDHSPREN